MNLLGAKLYDPSTAASASCASLLAMTAVDTTNLRLTVTVPAHGFLLFKLRCVIEGATTFPQILLGVLNGASVVGRQSPLGTTDGTPLATTRAPQWAEFVATGLAAGSTNFDAAYGVEVVVASTNIKYGGPNNTTTDDAWGAFVFEIWDPQPIPTAAPGAANGLLISGSNAGTTTLGALTITGATTHTGNVVLSDGLTVSAPSTLNRAGITITGNGTGAAISGTGGATGAGVLIAGGGTSGDGIKVTTTSGHGVNLAPVGTSMHGFFSTGGNGGTSDGIKAVAGTGGVDIRGNITGNLVGTVSTLTTYTGNTPQTGDSFAIVKAGGTGDNAAIKAKTDNLPASPASTTNITAGTITTVTNLTNAATAGDLTATMKTSVQTAADAAITANATIIEIESDTDTLTAGVTVSTNNDKTGYALSSAEENAIADALLDRAAGVETGLTLRQFYRLSASVILGKSSGMNGPSAAFRDTNDTKNRVVASLDGNGGRTAVTLDAS